MSGMWLKRLGIGAAGLAAVALGALLLRPEPTYAAINVNVSLNNATPAFSGTVVGIGGQTDPFMFFPHEQIRGVSDDDFAVLMSRIKKGGISFVRMWIQVDWWEPVNDNGDSNTMNDAGFAWNSTEMTSLKRYLSALKDAGVDVELNTMINDPSKLYPWLLWDNWGDALPADDKRPEFAESMAALVKHLVVTEGYTNVKFLSLYNEPENIITVPPGKDRLGYYKQVYQDVANRLSAEGLSSAINLSGIEVGFLDTLGQPWFESFTQTMGDYMDAYTTHAGPSVSQLMDGSFSDRVASWTAMKNTNDANGSVKPFMFTEMGALETRSVALDGLHFASEIADGLRNGVAGFSKWRLYDDWYSALVGANQTMTGSGDYGWGAINGKQEHYTPKPAYYAMSLMAKFVPKGSTTYTTASSNPLVVPAVVSAPGGKHTVAVVNWSSEPASVSFALQSALSTTFKVYKYDESQQLDGLGKFPASIGTKNVSGTAFSDTIPPRTLYVYTDIPDATAPAQVTGATASAAAKTATVTWTANADADLAYYKVYRSEIAGFTPTEANLIDEVWIQTGAAPVYHDRNVAPGRTYYYKVAAADTSENVGAASAQASAAVPQESFGNALTLTNSATGQYYEVASTYDGGYKYRVSKASGGGLYVEDADGTSWTNIAGGGFTYPIVYKYDSGAFAEQLANGGMESGASAPDGWSNWTSGGGTLSWDSSVSHTGGRSLKVMNTANTQNSTWLQAIPNVTPGTNFEFGYWMKLENVSLIGYEGQGASAVIVFKDAAGNQIASTGELDSKKDTHNWFYNNISAKAPEGTDSVLIQLRIYGSAGTAWFDDVSLVKSGTKVIPDLTNGPTSVTANDLAASHKQIVTAQGNETLTYDFYPDRIEMKVTGPQAGGYLIEEAGYPYKYSGRALWPDGTVGDLASIGLWKSAQKTAVSVALQQFNTPYQIKYAFGAAKPVSIQNGYRIRGYYPRFQVNSGEVYTITFPKTNMGANAGMEAGTGTAAPAGWSNWTGGTGAFSWDGTTAHTGSKSVKIVNATTANSAWLQVVANPEYNKELNVSGWVKTSGVAGANGAMIAIEARDASGTILAEQWTPVVTGTQDWTKVSVRFTPPAGTVSLNIGGRLWTAAGTAWFDDIVVAPADNGANNPGAETGAAAPEGWNTWTTAGAPFSWDSAERHSGGRSLKIVNGGAAFSSWNQLLPSVARGGEYEFGGWVKTSAIAGAGGAAIAVSAKDFDGIIVQEARTSYATGSNGWTYVSGKIVLPPNTEYVYLESRVWNASGTAWFDDVTFKLVRNR
ncbi:carbohydrate binding domain-containing protein [Cohnella hashimotonis]|uniref:Fibronectin type-III domain-containing protein n=1 Tax=Cohnella hashimotonis TaxID=2826895 RepID=A0ABT6TJD1_9BACL|nr:carbohydrate binding domain-containing protein [Cohnella hashimotonis]MDI4646666.1 hypothetical protein [Cohnella hashimotonis]